LKTLLSAIAVAALIAMTPRAASAQDASSIVVVGAGYTGSWDTEVVLANPYDGDLAITAYTARLSSAASGCQADPCPPPYPVFLTLPAHGQGTFHYSDVKATGVSALYISTDDGVRLPVARARAYDVQTPSRAMGLPVISFSTLAARPPGPFMFPGARRSSSAHSNLVVVESSNLVNSSAAILIEAVNADGVTVASTTRSIAAGRSVIIPDLLGVMGLSDFDGTVRVTQTGGTGIIDGALAILTDDGGFAVSEGFNP